MTTNPNKQAFSRLFSNPLTYVFLCMGWFFASGLLLIPYPGVENDEALFASGIYAPERMAGSIDVFGHPVALMLMDYLGALKASLYSVILAVWEPTLYSLRLPVLLLACFAIWLYYKCLETVAGRKAALIGAVLLATDVTFILTSTFDWGPVVLQHTLLLGGLLFCLRFHRRPRLLTLAAGFFCFGLALWDKALFLWVFSGIVIAFAVVLPRVVRSHLSARKVLVAGGSFLLGTLPFVLHNLTHGFQTFQGKGYSLEHFGRKLLVFRFTLEGRALAGFLIDFGGDAPPLAPSNLIESASAWLGKSLGYPMSGFLPHALVAAVLLAFFSWKTPRFRLLLFLVIAFFVAWTQMLLTTNAGGAAHHTVLLMPLVIGFIAVSLAGAMERFRHSGPAVVVSVLVLVVAGNFLVWNSHLAGFLRWGPGVMWSDASEPLARYLQQSRPSAVYAADWGMGDMLRLYLGRRISVGNAIEPFSRQELDDFEREWILRRASDPGSVFVSYAEGRDMFPNAKRLVWEWTAANGYRRQPLAVIRDRRGRDIFLVYRFVPEGPLSAANSPARRRAPVDTARR